MTQKISWLAGVLALQLVLALSLFLLGGNATDFKAGPLFQFDEKNVDKLVISDGKETVTLEKSDAGWMVTGLNGLSAAHTKVEALIARLASLQSRWPVATTPVSHQRFEVSEDKFQRKVEIYANKQPLGVLFVGDSPGFKKSHVRVDGADAVYSLELNAYDLPASSTDWLDKTLLTVNNLTRIKGRDFEINKDTDGWRFPGQEQQVNQQQAEALDKALGAVQVMAVAENPPALEGDNLITITVDGDGTYTYQLLKVDEKYYIKRSDIAPVFTLSQYEFERLAKPDGQSLSLIEPEQSDNAAEQNKTAE